MKHIHSYIRKQRQREPLEQDLLGKSVTPYSQETNSAQNQVDVLFYLPFLALFLMAFFCLSYCLCSALFSDYNYMTISNSPQMELFEPTYFKKLNKG